MPYLTIDSTEYLVRVGQSRGQQVQIEGRRRAIDGTLLVDPIAMKRSVQVEIAGLWADDRFFTPEEADALIAMLVAGAVSVGGDVGAFTARAADVGFVDGQSWEPSPAYDGGEVFVYRWVTCTLEEV